MATCGDKSVGIGYFSDDKCKTAIDAGKLSDDQKALTVKFGECVSYGGKNVKMTKKAGASNASFLKAGALAIMALAASQFWESKIKLTKRTQLMKLMINYLDLFTG